MFFCFYIALLLPSCESWNILFVHSFAGGSHLTVSTYTANLLASRNHTVTYVSTNVPKALHPSIKVIPLVESTSYLNHFLDVTCKQYVTTGRELPPTELLGAMGPLVKKLSKTFFHTEGVARLMYSGEKFDAVIVWMMEFPGYALAHHLKIDKVIVTNPAPALMPSTTDKISMSSAVLQREGPMLTGFVENSMLSRAKNLAISTIFDNFFSLVNRFYFDPHIMEDVPDFPGLAESYKKVKLTLFHHHPLVDAPYDLGPSVISVGGSLCTSYKPDNISPDIHSFLKDTTGFIIFSLGSHISEYTEEQQNILITAFSELPFQVIWRNKNKVANLPPNVLVVNWLPQAMLLQHPMIKVFITHGGYASKIEGFCGGVPMLVLPCFAPDQHLTAKILFERGLGLKMDSLLEMTSEDIVSKVLEVDQGPYRGRMQDLQRQILLTRLTDDQVMGYIDVVISGGSLGPEPLMWYQYLYYDLILVPVVVILVTKWFVTWFRN